MDDFIWPLAAVRSHEGHGVAVVAAGFGHDTVVDGPGCNNPDSQTLP